MKIKAKIDRMVNSGNVKAIASVSLDGMFVVKNLKVMDGKKGLFVSMPQNSYTAENGETRYSDVFHPITAQARSELYDKVLEAYEQKLEESQEQDEGEEVSEEADQGMEQSM